MFLCQKLALARTEYWCGRKKKRSHSSKCTRNMQYRVSYCQLLYNQPFSLLLTLQLSQFCSVWLLVLPLSKTDLPSIIWTPLSEFSVFSVWILGDPAQSQKSDLDNPCVSLPISDVSLFYQLSQIWKQKSGTKNVQ